MAGNDFTMQFNRLLAYRPLDRLQGMSDAERADLLRELLRAEPGESTWRSVYELFALWPEGEAKSSALDGADRELASWDDGLRAADTASRALFDGSGLASLARIVRSISIHRRADGGGAELLAIVTSAHAASLTRLNIVRSEIGRGAWLALVESPHLRRLQHLQVANTVMGAEVLRAVFASPRLAALRGLKLSDIAVDATGLRAIVRADPAFELQVFELSRSVLEDEGAALLAAAPWLRAVGDLTLRHDFITEPGMRALLASPNLRPGARLDLRGNEAGAGTQAALRSIAAERGLGVVW